MVISLNLLMFLVTSTHSLDITCDFYDDEWAMLGNVYTCSVKNLTTRILNENVTNIFGTHSEGRSNKDVIKLNIQKQTCEFLPRGFEKFFPNLEGLRIAQSGLVALTQSDLSVFPKLRNCDMFNNYLNALESEIFANCPLLEYLYFGDNQIRTVGYNILKPLKNLKKAIFQGNVCSVQNAQSKVEIVALQKALNRECSTGDEFENLLKEYEEQKQKAEEFMRKYEEDDRKLNELVNKKVSEKNGSSSILLWACALIALLVTISLIYAGKNLCKITYFAKLKRGNKARDTDSVTGFLPPYSEMCQEETPTNINTV